MYRIRQTIWAATSTYSSVRWARLASLNGQDNQQMTTFPRRQLTAAAKSICPTAIAGFTPPPDREGAVPAAVGRDAVGIIGFPGIFGAPGFAASGGPGLGLAAIGGGALGIPAADDGRELFGLVLAFEGVDFFQGVAEPLEGAMPGKTDTGLADASAVTVDDFVVEVAVDFGVLGGGRRPAGGGRDAAAAAALGLGGTNSR